MSNPHFYSNLRLSLCGDPTSLPFTLKDQVPQFVLTTHAVQYRSSTVTGGIRFVGSGITFPFLIFIGGSRVVLAENWAMAASVALRMIGSWEWSIHPRAQLIFGCAVVNHGYPRMILWLPRSVRKYHRLVCRALVLVFMST